jgi:hypothetical protein
MQRTWDELMEQLQEHHLRGSCISEQEEDQRALGAKETNNDKHRDEPKADTDMGGLSLEAVLAEA